MPDRSAAIRRVPRRVRTAGVPADVRRVFLGIGVSALGNGLVLPYLMIYARDVRGFSTATAGLLMAWMGLLGLVGAPLIGTFIDRLGPWPVLVAALATQATGHALLAFVTTPTQGFGAVFVAGSGAAGVWPAASAMMARLVSPAERQRVFGVQFMLINAGIGVGGLVASMIVDVHRVSTFQVLFLADAVGMLVYVLVLLTRPNLGRRVVAPAAADAADPASGSAAGGGDGGGYRALLRDRTFLKFLAFSFVMVLSGYAQIDGGLPLFVTGEAGLPTRAMGWAFAANTAAIVAGQMITLRLLRGRSRTRALTVTGGLWATCWVIIGGSALAHSPAVTTALVMLALAVFGIGETIYSPVMPAVVNELAPDELRGRYNAMSAMTWGVSSIVAPAIAGPLIGAGLSPVWLGACVLGCVVGAAGALRLRRSLTAGQDGRPISPAAGAPLGPPHDLAVVD